MTLEESKILKEHLKVAAMILLSNTPKEELKNFASIELAVSDHLLNEVAREIENFFKRQQQDNYGQEQKDSDTFIPSFILVNG